MKPAVFKSDLYQTATTHFADLATPQRYKNFNKGVVGFDFLFPEFTNATNDDIRLVHSQEHIDFIKGIDKLTYLDDEITCVHPEAYDFCSLTLGGVKLCIDMFKSNEAQRAISIGCCGHHAHYDYAAGYCIFNSAAFAVKYAETIGLSAVVIDWDVHFGDGTYSLIGDKLFSIHQHPIYPMTGGNASANIIPIDSGGDKEYIAILEGLNIGNPDIIIISCGFDIHVKDFMSDIKVTYDGLAKMVQNVLGYNKPILFSIEGGYNQDILEECVRTVANQL